MGFAGNRWFQFACLLQQKKVKEVFLVDFLTVYLRNVLQEGLPFPQEASAETTCSDADGHGPQCSSRPERLTKQHVQVNRCAKQIPRPQLMRCNDPKGLSDSESGTKTWGQQVVTPPLGTSLISLKGCIDTGWGNTTDKQGRKGSKSSPNGSRQGARSSLRRGRPCRPWSNTNT